MSYGVQFLLICAMVVLGCGKVTLQGRVSRIHLNNAADSVLFNAKLFLAMALVLALVLPLGRIEVGGIGLAIGGALSSFLFQTTYALALRTGPVSLSVMIANFNVLFVSIFTVIVYDEKVYLTQLIGVAFLVISMLLSTKKDTEKRGVSGKWLLLIFMAMLMTGLGTIFSKIYVKSYGAELENSENTYIVFVYLFASLLAFIYYFFTAHIVKKEKNTYGFFNRNVWLYALAIGIVLGGFQKLYLVGMEYIDGAFMFPTYAGMQSLGMTVIGLILFKDKLSLRQKIGIAFGIGCVVLMNIRFYVLF